MINNITWVNISSFCKKKKKDLMDINAYSAVTTGLYYAKHLEYFMN